MKDHRLVYSTEKGRVCSGCGCLPRRSANGAKAGPENDCKCSKNATSAKVPDRVVAKLRIEKAGRGGKTVTVVYDLPRNAEFLKTLCAELKRSCGTGGTAGDDTVELQGDHRDRVRDVLRKKGMTVKG